MSNPDSFIDEVNEEVRRDRMSALLRRWGWLALLIVVAIVAAASWSQWQQSRETARAQAFGDAVLAALSASDLPARRAALTGVATVTPAQDAILSMLQATTLLNGEGADPAGARAALLALADADGLDDTYRHLALLKVVLEGGTGDAAGDAAILERLAVPGAPYRLLAVEQQAIAALAGGDVATAVTLLRTLSEDADATESLRRRALQLIVALGASPNPA